MPEKTMYKKPLLITPSDFQFIVLAQSGLNVFQTTQEFSDCVSARAFIRWNLDVTGLHGDMSITIEVSSTTQDLILAIPGQVCTDANGSGQSETIVFIPPSLGTYQLLIETNEVPPTGSYTLKITSPNTFNAILDVSSCSASVPLC